MTEETIYMTPTGLFRAERDALEAAPEGSGPYVPKVEK
jgi:hypothetical protein